ncbi:MAG: hypothetical protein Q8P49_01355 [Candidatus Liptonbacteria bacterium]|nr:hypothetical protein [Candidatus Liptonbacteria bacterium]
MKLIFLVGLPTTGKSSLGKRLQEVTGIRFLDIDSLAFLCFGLPESNAYSSDESKERDRRRMLGAYHVLATATYFNLARSDSLIIAATFSRPLYWEELFLPILGKYAGTEPRVIWHQILHNEERTVTERLSRDGYLGGCKSLDHYLKDKARYVPPPTELPQIILDTSRPPDVCLAQALEFIGS